MNSSTIAEAKPAPHVPDRLADEERRWLPDGFSVLARFPHARACRVFPAADGALLVMFQQDEPYGDFSRHPLVWRVLNGKCEALGKENELPDVGIVDLNLDPGRRWGLRYGLVEDKTGIFNSADRTLVGAGVLRSGVPWMAFTTDPGFIKGRVYVTDLFLWQNGEWRLSWSSYPTNRTWFVAVSRSDDDGVAAVEAPNFRPSVQPKYEPWSLRIWVPEQRSRRFPLTRLPLLEGLAQPWEVASFDDGSIVIIGEDSDRQMTVERFTVSDRRSTFAKFPEVKLLVKGWADMTLADGRRSWWDVHFESSRSFLLWRRDEPTLHFEYAETQGTFKYHPVARPAPEEAVLAALAQESSQSLYGVYILASGETLVLLWEGPGWYVLSDRPVKSPCRQ